MTFDALFFLNSILFGIGLAMDAFSVSIANAFKEGRMKPARMSLIAGTFGLFQIIMPLVGWLCVRTISEIFREFQKFIPWIALALLLFLGLKMIIESVRGEAGDEDNKAAIVGFGALMIQGVATSIDALSVGFTISEYTWVAAIVESVIIGVVTFGICMGGLILGRKVGSFLKNKAGIVGGIILIAIGLEIFIKGVFF